MKKEQYNVIVVGGGHAGCEAALAAARMNCETILITLHVGKITSKHPYHLSIQALISRYHNFASYQKIFPLEQNNPRKSRKL